MLSISWIFITCVKTHMHTPRSYAKMRQRLVRGQTGSADNWKKENTKMCLKNFLPIKTDLSPREP